MGYFNYHGTAKRLIAEGRLTGYYYTAEYHGIRPALVLFFDDLRHPVMHVRQYRWDEYASLLDPEKELSGKPNFL